jgi:predicted enzyme related to lactoylglutathione lyase
MLKLMKITGFTIFTTFCLIIINTGNYMSGKTNNNEKEAAAVKDTTPRVTGIGGIFYSTKDPKKTREWYGNNLGLAIVDYGSIFETRNANKPEEINYLIWSPFKEGSDYFSPSKKEFMINYRVENIDWLVEQLKKEGIKVLDDIQTYEYGKFVHILDPEENKIELWEPLG